MRTIIASLEPFYFSSPEDDRVLVVRIFETSHQAALKRFKEMSWEEKRKASVSHLSHPDHSAFIASWLGRCLPRLTRVFGHGG